MTNKIINSAKRSINVDQIIDAKAFNQFIIEIKAKVKVVQIKSLRAVNQELIQLYFNIGKSIVEKQKEQGWGKSVIEILAKELQFEFTNSLGFSPSNLWRMRNFYLIYEDNQKLAQLVREIAWSHNLIIMERCKDNLEREYYLQMTKRSSWSRNILANSIKNQSYQKFLLSQTNFSQTLPQTRQNDAVIAIKDEYSFDFLNLGDEHLEKELEKGLINNIKNFLTEMGNYFAFIGNQYRIEIDNEEYFIDLLLYHRKLRCLVAIELKTGKFQPEHAGKMQFYLSALDDIVRLEDEHPSIGIIICQEKSRTKVEYTLRDLKKPMGISTYNSSRKLPKEIENLLPSEDEIIKYLKVFEKSSQKV
jgi:predicted nuclease of restriction endonuclease-like (RecB) superfamily